MGLVCGLLWVSGALFGHSQAKYARKKKVSFLISMFLFFVCMVLLLFLK